MAEIIDRMELNNDQRVELYEEGVTRLVQVLVPGVQPAQAVTLDVAAAIQLFHFLQVYEEQLVRWRDGHTP
jgi:hypothetical protein